MHKSERPVRTASISATVTAKICPPPHAAGSINSCRVTVAGARNRCSTRTDVSASLLFLSLAMRRIGIPDWAMPMARVRDWTSSLVIFLVQQKIVASHELGVALLPCFTLLMCCFCLGSHPSLPWTPNAAALRVGLCMSPGVLYHSVEEQWYIFKILISWFQQTP